MIVGLHVGFRFAAVNFGAQNAEGEVSEAGLMSFLRGCLGLTGRDELLPQIARVEEEFCSR